MSVCNFTISLKPEKDVDLVTIVAEGGDNLQANRNALMKASSVFSVLLKDSQTSRIEVNDEKEIFELFLEYINTGKVKESVMKLYSTDLLYLANKVFPNQPLYQPVLTLTFLTSIICILLKILVKNGLLCKFHIILCRTCSIWPIL